MRLLGNVLTRRREQGGGGQVATPKARRSSILEHEMVAIGLDETVAAGWPVSAVRVKGGAGPDASPPAANAVVATTTAAMVQRFNNLAVKSFIDLSSVENG